MKYIFLFLAIVFIALPVNSQTDRFLQVFLELKSSKGGPIACNEKDDVERSILYEYGAVFISKDAILPEVCKFKNELSVTEFADLFLKNNGQPLSKNEIQLVRFGFGDFFLQKQAKESLERVFKALKGYENVARNCNDETRKTCIDRAKKSSVLNDNWALRTYYQTERNSGLTREVTKNDIPETKKWEPGIKYRDQKRNRPLMYQTAFPGSSQHHLGLAIDVNDERNEILNGRICGANCTKILNDNGWFRTVRYDQYHFTYLGYTDTKDLENLGLKKVRCKDYSENTPFEYWVPKISGYKGIGTWTCE